MEIAAIDKKIMFVSCLLAVIATPALSRVNHKVVQFAQPPLWSGLPADDDGDGNGAYDRATGLSVGVNCIDDGARRHVLTVQFSSSRPRALQFYATIVPQTGHAGPQRGSASLRRLTPAHPMLTSKRVVETCGKPYEIYVAYPKQVPT